MRAPHPESSRVAAVMIMSSSISKSVSSAGDRFCLASDETPSADAKAAAPVSKFESMDRSLV